MTVSSIAALFAAMTLLAAMPSVSVLAVSARAASSGFAHGACTALGVVAGDLLFILLALFGLALLVDALGGLFVLVKYVGGAYLIWLGIALWRSRTRPARAGAAGGASLGSSFMTGLLITLGDQKAILFYLGFLPAFMDLSAVTCADAAAVAAVAVVAVGGVKLGYAYAAHRAGAVLGGRVGGFMNGAAALLVIAAGIVVMARA